MATTARQRSPQDQVPAALAYLTEQHTADLRAALEVSTHPAEAFLITIVLQQRGEG